MQTCKSRALSASLAERTHAQHILDARAGQDAQRLNALAEETHVLKLHANEGAERAAATELALQRRVAELERALVAARAELQTMAAAWSLLVFVFWPAFS